MSTRRNRKGCVGGRGKVLKVLVGKKQGERGRREGDEATDMVMRRDRKGDKCDGYVSHILCVGAWAKPARVKGAREQRGCVITAIPGEVQDTDQRGEGKTLRVNGIHSWRATLQL